jgi:hypothetical protein
VFLANGHAAAAAGKQGAIDGHELILIAVISS